MTRLPYSNSLLEFSTALVIPGEWSLFWFEAAEWIHVCPFLLQDLLYVIAYGPSQVKPPAVQMLFHYWPNLKPPGAISEYRGLQYTGKESRALGARVHLPHATEPHLMQHHIRWLTLSFRSLGFKVMGQSMLLGDVDHLSPGNLGSRPRQPRMMPSLNNIS